MNRPLFDLAGEVGQPVRVGKTRVGKDESVIHISQEDVTTAATIVLALTATGALVFNAKATRAAERAATAAEKGVEATKAGLVAAEKAAEASRDAAAASAANVEVLFDVNVTFGSQAPLRVACSGARVYVRSVILKRIIEASGRTVGGPEMVGRPNGFGLPRLMHRGEAVDFLLGDGEPWIPLERLGARAHVDISYGFVADTEAGIKHEECSISWT